MQGQTIQGEKYLRRLEFFIDVVYALVFFEILNYLPQAEDLSWLGRPWGILNLLIDHSVDLLRLLVGLGIIIIYWNQSNRLLSPVKKTNGVHATLALLQLTFVCFFVYFAISDPQLLGIPWTPVLQSSSLVFAGLFLICSWFYARRKQLIDPEFSEADQRKITNNGFIEPISALLTIPAAWFGALAWTLAWILIPIFITLILKWKNKIPKPLI